MYEDTEKFVDQAFEQSVRVEAYHLWEEAGKPEGREHDFWFQALEKLLLQKAASASENAATDIADLSRSLTPEKTH